MVKSFMASPKYIKSFVFWSYVVSQVIWLLLFWGNSLLFLIAPVFVIPLSVIVSALVWRILNSIAAQQGVNQTDWGCSNCHAANRSNVISCAYCGTPRQ